jgi:molybdenum-dependent DNA-binding transcriptional regulator ModE
MNDGREDEPADAGRAGRLDHADAHLGLLREKRRSDVEDAVDAPQRRVQAAAVAQIADRDLSRAALTNLVRLGPVMDQCANDVATPGQFGNNQAREWPGGADRKDFHGRIRHRPCSAAVSTIRDSPDIAFANRLVSEHAVPMLEQWRAVDLNDLRVFEKVGALLSFSAAARALGVPKSSVSRGVARLEGALGVRLCQRTTREVVLTEAGGALLQRCAEIMGRIEEAVDYLGGVAAAPRGTCASQRASALA